MFCAYTCTRPRYQVSVYMAIGPLVLFLQVNLADLPIRDKFIPVLETVFEGVINQTKEDEKKIVKKTEKKIISESHDFTTLKNIIGNEIDVEPDISSDKTESVANAGSIDIGLKSGMHDNSALEIIEESKLYVETANDRETHGYSTPESILDINEMCNETGTSSDKSESVANAGLNDIRKISETHDNGAVESVIDINEIYNETGISSDDCSALDSIIDINEIYNETGISSDDYCALDSIIDINEIYNETGTSSDTSEPVANAGSNDIRKISETLDDGALANIIENKLYVEPSSDRRTYDYSALESIIDCEMYNDETETSGELNSPHPTVFKQADIAETSGELNSAHSTVLKQTDIAEHLELNDTRMKIPCGGKKSKVDS